MAKLRLDKFISSQMNISRTDAKRLLRQNSVFVNGKAVSKAETSVDTDKDSVTVSGKEIVYKKYIYIMMNKPKGVVSATEDGRDITVLDILPEHLRRNGLFPAGRLDKDTTGFVLITDDGAFAHNMLSPAHHIEKTYTVGIEEKVTPEDEKRFFEGMEIGGELFRPAKLKFLYRADEDKLYYYEIKITEGRYHQIKRMFASTGKPVIELRRTHLGYLSLDSALKPGEAREITEIELKKILP